MNKVDMDLVVEVNNKNLNEFKSEDVNKHEVFVMKSEENMNMDETVDVNSILEKLLCYQC